MLGVCLGHQAIAEVFGSSLRNLDQVYHGVSSPISVNTKDPLFLDLPEQIEVGRYHSWVVDNSSLGHNLTAIAVDEQGEIQAIRHKEFDLCGVQFHPESVMTPQGSSIIKNFLTHSKSA